MPRIHGVRERVICPSIENMARARAYVNNNHRLNMIDEKMRCKLCGYKKGTYDSGYGRVSTNYNMSTEAIKVNCGHCTGTYYIVPVNKRKWWQRLFRIVPMLEVKLPEAKATIVNK